MKHKLPLFLATLCLGASAQAAVLDISSITGGGITGTFPTTPYSDSNGITITYEPGSPFASTESSGYSGDNGRGMNGLTGFPDGHLAVGPGDTVTLDFSSISPSTVEITFIDLDGSGNNNESVVISSVEGGPFAEAGFDGVILNSEAHLESNLVRRTFTPVGNTVIIEAAGVGNGNDTGYFAFTVATDGDAGPVIPEPSSSLLALLGLSLVTFRRRRR